LHIDDDKKLINSLPEKYITVQFNGNLIRNKFDNDQEQRILKNYTDQGYSLVHIGKESQDNRFKGNSNCLKNIMIAIQNAEYHVGIDSGMMHLAKCLKPADKIHIYSKNDHIGAMVYPLVQKGSKYNLYRD